MSAESKFIQSVFKKSIALRSQADTAKTIQKAIAAAKQLPAGSQAVEAMSANDGIKGLSGTDVYIGLLRHAKLSFGKDYSATQAYQDAQSHGTAPKKPADKPATKPKTSPEKTKAPVVDVCRPALDFPTAIRQFFKSLGRSDEWIHSQAKRINQIARRGRFYDENGRYTRGSGDTGFHDIFKVDWGLLRSIGPINLSRIDIKDKKVTIRGYSVTHSKLLRYMGPIKKECSLKSQAPSAPSPSDK